ncbi:hypothetical protein ACEUZ9_001192 [Paracoccus litorisediminis]|jgi:hypothetical protein|uniref:Uncharacterized protein n=1 Tax=Paracoccus litorisediminis TaxID=2006130 RepID=A0A844HIE1_9RHOB|nr:hypothetical protein [Paracoccus litorisediminis]MTH58768.1 hypothetical protein [Paracoccus litorisediminis]
MAVNAQEKPAAPANPEAPNEQTRPDALKLLDDAALAALMKELRGVKAAATEAAVRKELAQALHRASEEKLARMARPKKDKRAKPAKVVEPAAEGDEAPAKPAHAEKPARAEKPVKPAKPTKADKLEERRLKLEEKAAKLEDKRRKLAEKAEKIRVKEAERAERKSTPAGKVGGKAAAQA